MEACAKSSKNCLFINRKSQSQSPKVSSFFKVMFGKQYSQVLFLPPKFAKKLRVFVGEIMYLRNSSNGQKWKVVLSNVHGTLAFQKGWHEFSITHGIEMGDFVVFHYIEGSLQFFIQVFTKSGCERLTSSSSSSSMGKSYQKRRVKTTRDTFESCSRDDAYYTVPPPSAKKHLSARAGGNNVTKSPPVPGNIPRGLNGDMNFDKDGHNKKDLSDLSIFEMPDKKTVVREDETAAYTLLKFEESCSLKREYSSRKTNKPAEMPQKYECLARSVGSLSSWERNAVPRVPHHERIASGFEETSSWFKGQRELSNLGQTPIQILKPEPMPGTQSSQMAGKITVFKQEPRGFIEDVSDDSTADFSLGVPRDNADFSVTDGGLHMIVKYEPIQVFDFSPPSVTSITCLVHSDNASFLELPEPLPIKACRAVKSEKKMVILRDPAGRLWPVLYHQMNGIKVLASGWATFRKTNNILQGDECTFSLENRDEAIFAVTVMTPGNLIQAV